MKVLLAIERSGHAFWDRNSYSFRILDMERNTEKFLDFYNELKAKRKDWTQLSAEYYIREEGVFARLFACGSGYGKSPMTEEFLVYPRSNYDDVVIIPNKVQRYAEERYQGNWRDNSDFTK